MCRLAKEAVVYMDALKAAGYSADDVISMVSEVKRVREAMLGSRADRQLNSGRADFERHSRARPLKNAPRCYGLNNMVQQPRRVESTPATLKTFDDEHDEYQERTHEFLCVRVHLVRANLIILSLLISLGDHKVRKRCMEVARPCGSCAGE